MNVESRFPHIIAPNVLLQITNRWMNDSYSYLSALNPVNYFAGFSAGAAGVAGAAGASVAALASVACCVAPKP